MKKTLKGIVRITVGSIIGFSAFSSSGINDNNAPHYEPSRVEINQQNKTLFSSEVLLSVPSIERIIESEGKINIREAYGGKEIYAGIKNKSEYERENYLNAVIIESDKFPINQEDISYLELIAKNDDSPTIRRLAESMVKSYEKEGDFHDTEPYKEYQAEKVRLTIKIKTEFGYDPQDVWYTREQALENLAGANIIKIPKQLITDLKTIAKKEDDWRIKELAEEMVKSYEEYGDLHHVDPEYIQEEHENCRCSELIVPTSPCDKP